MPVLDPQAAIKRGTADVRVGPVPDLASSHEGLASAIRCAKMLPYWEVCLQQEQRRLAAILAADVAGYSRLMAADESGTLARLSGLRAEVLDPKIAQFHGRIVGSAGDSLLVEFASAVNAVQCAVEIQVRLAERNAGLPEDKRMVFRMGVNLGDVIPRDGTIHGDGVNIAARLEKLAEPGGICIGSNIYDQVRSKLVCAYDDLGDQQFHNIPEPVRAFRVRSASVAVGPSRPAGALRLPDKPSIAVLPFTNMSGDPEQEYFSDGITEDIITDLSKVSGLFVPSRNSSFAFKGKAIPMDRIVRELGVGHVVEGSVRKSGNRIRISAQLIEGQSGGHLWAERYDRDLTDIFAIQDEITRAIVDQLRVRLLPEEKKAIEQAPTGNAEAYAYFLRGREFRHRALKPNLLLAKQMYAKAIEIDPRYARAYVGIVFCDSRLRSMGDSSIQFADILATADKALSADPSLAEAHAARGFALSVGDCRAEAAAAFQRAFALDPNCHEANIFYGEFSFSCGDFETARKHYARAMEINPDDYQSPFQLSMVLKSLGRDDEVEKYARLGIERAEKALKLFPEDSLPVQLMATALAALGESERAKEWLARALAIDPDDLINCYNAACTYSLLGELDRAIDLLEVCLKQVGNDFKRWFKNDSDLDPIRAHPRYARLLELAHTGGD